ncbi:putative protein kinase ArgK-like GTPase of G3E family [Caldanaerobacter subterraneus subsp. tengcongensis MB4]|nr:putative protein kinase ArgK-like GTPase of G3E family [Caldanaerobacter subterraneus subsp. tengcongensis MB4]
MMELEKLLLNRDKRAIARAITYAEDDKEKMLVRRLTFIQ